MEEIFQPNLNMPEVHAPTIAEMPNGDLLAAWFGGSIEGARDIAIYSSRLPKGSNEWKEPTLLADTEDRPDQNPVLFVDGEGTIWLFYVAFEEDTKGPLPISVAGNSIIMVKRSRDNGFTWGPPKRLRPRRGLWVRNKPITLRNGDVVLPIYDNAAIPTSCYVMVSEDSGSTWETYGPITTPTGCAHGNVVELSDGSLLMYMRCRSHPLHPLLGMPRNIVIQFSPTQAIEKRESLTVGGYIWKSTSLDKGRTWSQAVETQFRNPNSGISLLHLKSGSLVLAFNDTHIGRTPLSLALSPDEGRSWPFYRILEKGEGEYSYPQLMQTRDGLIHVVYTNRRISIKRAVFNEEWIGERVER